MTYIYIFIILSILILISDIIALVLDYIEKKQDDNSSNFNNNTIDNGQR